MKNVKTTSAILFAVIMINGCTSFDKQPNNAGATFVASSARSLPPDVYPAVIWSIDGRRVSTRKTAHRITAGQHAISVLPRQDGGPALTRAWAASARSRGINILEMTIDVEDGQDVMLAAVVRRHRVYTHENGEKIPLGPLQTTVLPYVIFGEK